jgi:hypothetical protein
MGTESSAPSLFGRRPGSETAVGQILESSLDRFGSGFDDPAASDDPLAYGGLFSSNRNRTDSGPCHKEGEKMAAVRDVGKFGSGLGILRLIIIVTDPELQQQHHHTLSVLTFMVLIMTGMSQQLKLVLAYSRMLLLTSGQQA